MNEKCKFVNPTSGDLGDALGLTQKRMDEISFGMDKMVGSLNGLVYMSQILSSIEDLCNTQEELVWAFTNHIEWLAVTGRLVPSINKNVKYYK